jgi:hypothetical protein
MELDHRSAEPPFQCSLTFAGQIIEPGTTSYRLALASPAADAYDFHQITEWRKSMCRRYWAPGRATPMIFRSWR